MRIIVNVCSGGRDYMFITCIPRRHYESSSPVIVFIEMQMFQENEYSRMVPKRTTENGVA